MFEKLLSLLPYNPGLAGQMAFYSRRMREESSIRRTGMVFLTLAFLIQFVAVLAPPQSTLAANDNDLVYGGIDGGSLSATRKKAKDACMSDARGFQRIMHYYGISCAKFDDATEHSIGDLSNAGQHYYSMGHNSVGQTYKGTPTDEQSVTIPGAGTLFWRQTSIWNGNPWHVLQLTDYQGKTFYVIYDCGNLMTVGVPPHNQLPSGEDTVTIIGGTGNVPNTPATPAPTPAAPAPAATPVDTTTTVPTTATAHVICKYDYRIYDDDANCPKDCIYNATISATNPKCFEPCAYNTSIPVTDNQCYQPCEYNGALHSDDEQCKPCQKSTNAQDADSCVEIRKTAANVTAGLADANNTTAKGGDVITYTLYAHNNGKATVKDFVFQESIGDVLDYADISDFHGGIIDSNKLVRWPAQDIKSDGTITAQITVKVKSPVPQTPASSSDPTHFDLTMTNVYGNTITIKLPGSPAKTIEATATSLPNTGPGTSLMIAGTIVILGGYFYGRARLLAKESNIALKETAGV